MNTCLYLESEDKMQEDKIPKIFILYSWSRDDIVLPLTEHLVSHGVEVVLDKWELKDSQDKYICFYGTMCNWP